MNRDRATRLAGWISTAANILLTLGKGVIGIVAGSEALFADGIHSAADTVASAAALSALAVSNRPADEDHPYGHGKAEVVASAAVAAVLFLAGLNIVYTAGHSFFLRPRAPELPALYAAAVSLILKEVLYRYTAGLGRKLNSPALKALAEDHRSDIWASWAAIAGIGAAVAGEHLQVPQLAFADPLAALLVGLLILRLAYTMGKEAVHTLMERNVDPHLLQEFTELVLSVPEIRRVDRLRARTHGHYILVDVRAAVQADKTIQEGHDIIRQVKAAVMNAHPEVREVLVHLNPYYEEDDRDRATSR
ncbi:MAG: cation diffusion facilitator family transporter [Alicyclobacillaceae bacterium]|nr:cation diffusion facilitator family transporter [Alicyclobacillaceae bacterium]